MEDSDAAAAEDEIDVMGMDQSHAVGVGPPPDERIAMVEAGRPAGEYEEHELARIFPPMSVGEFDALKRSTGDAGRLHDPIALFDGRILDGRHRDRACRELGIAPDYRDWDGPGTALDYVLGRNACLRHLDQSQRAIVAARISTNK